MPSRSHPTSRTAGSPTPRSRDSPCPPTDAPSSRRSRRRCAATTPASPGSSRGPARTRRRPFVPGPQYALPLPAGLGVSELTPTGDGRLLALERGYEKATGNTVHLVLLDPAGATDVGGVAALTPATAGTPVRTTLLADLGACPSLGATARQPQRNPLLDNIEGMTVTGRAPDGALELLLVSDDNDSPQEVTRTYRLRTTLG